MLGGILQKADQIRDHVGKNPKAFSRQDADLIRALYVPEAKMKALMDEDTERFRKALHKTGNTVGSVEVIMTMTLRYEADVDLPTLAAEVGVTPEELLPRLVKSPTLSRSLGALKVPGATVARQAVVQAFADLVRELRLGGAIQPGVVGQSLPDNTGEIDPLEAQSSPANAIAFSPDGKLAAIASADKTVRIFDIDAGRDLRRCIGHTASVWAVAFSPDGTQVLSGSKDGTVRLWEVESARELRRLDGHTDLVTGVAFSPDGLRTLSVSLNGEAYLWDLDRAAPIKDFAFAEEANYLTSVAFAPDGKRCAICAGKTILLVDVRSGRVLRRLHGHAGWVVQAVFSAAGDRLLSGSDDRTARLWNLETGLAMATLQGHEGGVKSVAFSPGASRLLSGGNDATVRLWDAATAKEIRAFRKHGEPLVSVAFSDSGRQTLSGSRDAVVLPWRIDRLPGYWETIGPPRMEPTTGSDTPPPSSATILRPAAVIPVGGTISQVLLSPDRQTLYYLNLTEAVLGRLDLRTGDRQRLQLADATDAVCLTPDGSTLFATAPVKNGRATTCTLQLIDPVKMQVQKTWPVAISPYDVTASDSGLVYISGGGSEWSDIAVVDANKKATVVAPGAAYGSARSCNWHRPEAPVSLHARRRAGFGRSDRAAEKARRSARDIQGSRGRQSCPGRRIPDRSGWALPAVQERHGAAIVDKRRRHGFPWHRAAVRGRGRRS